MSEMAIMMVLLATIALRCRWFAVRRRCAWCKFQSADQLMTRCASAAGVLVRPKCVVWPASLRMR